MPIAPIVIKILGQDKFSNVIGRASKKMTQIGQGMNTIGRSMTMGLTVPILGAGIGAVKMSTDFNAAMARVGTLIPGQLKRLNELKTGVQSLSIETGKSTTELAEGLFQVISALGDGAETFDRLRVNARGAVGGVAETAAAIDLTALVTKNYGDVSAKATQKILDLAFKANELGVTTFPEMAESLGKVTPFAKTLGVQVEELFGVMGTFTGVAGNTSEVVTQLRGFLGGLLKPTRDMEIAFKKLGVRSGQELIRQKGLQGAMQALVDVTKPYPGVLGKVLGRKEALNLVLAATGAQAETFTIKLGKMATVAGAAELAFKAQTQGINKAGFAMTVLWRRVGVLAQKFGDALAPVIMDVIDLLTPMFKWMIALSPATKKLVFVIGLTVAAIGPLLLVFAGILTALPLMIVGFGLLGVAIGGAFLPITLVILAIASLTAAIITIKNNWKELGEAISFWWSRGLESMTIGLGKFVDGIKEAWQWVKDLGSAITNLDFGKVAELLGFGTGEGGAPVLDEGNLALQGALQMSNLGVRVIFENEPKGLRVEKEEGDNITEIERGLSTAGEG